MPAGDNFMADNGLTKAKAFFERAKYKEFPGLAIANSVDLWYTRPNYGLLNEKYEPVIFLTDSSDTSLRGFEGVAGGIKAASFVVEAFMEFRGKYLEIVRNSPVRVPPPIRSLSPVKGYERFHDKYTKYIDFVIDSYIRILEEDLENSHSNYEDFESFFLEMLSTRASSFPLTRSGFLLSSRCPLSVSGLYIELARLQYPNDTEKSPIINSRGFVCYAELADEYGLAIDKNAPWRLVADLESPRMQEYINRYDPNIGTNFQGYKNILSKLFRAKTHYDDIYSLQNIVISMYNIFVDKHPIVFSRRYDSVSETSRSTAHLREPLSATVNTRSTKYWISLLLKVRMMELDMNMDKYEFYNQKVLDYHDVYSVIYSRASKNPLAPALGKIGEICAGQIKKMYTKYAEINSFEKVTLADYI